MHFQPIYFALASMAALVSSAAIPEAEADASSPIEARVSPGFYFCKDTGFNGACYFDASPFGNCVTVGSDFNDQVSSAGPNNGLHCILYSNNGCTGSQITLYYPGSSDLSNQGFNDVMSSFRCYAN